MKSKITFLFFYISAHLFAQPTPISATIPYQGYEETTASIGAAEYQIFPDVVDGIIDKPIILLDGFDPGNTRDINAIYAVLDYGTGQNLADNLRGLGYDIIILDFPNGGDFVQRNAMVLIELINQINAIKVGDEENVIIGPSTGGLVARYGLRYMEMNSLSHETRLYVSFDTPHKGANIPIGFQHLFNYMAYGPVANAGLQGIVDIMFKSSLSREILIDQFEGHLQSGSETEFNPSILLPTGKPNFRNAFQSELDVMGLPQQTRNIAISNGSSNATMNGTPGMAVMDHTFDISATQRAIINLKFTPLANQTNQVSRFRAQTLVFGFWINVYESLANSSAPTFTSGLDSAPGSRFDLTGLAPGAGGDPLITEFFENLLIEYFTFVPTLSSLQVTSTQNWYQPFTPTSVTAFDATQVPTENENHVTLTTANMSFVLNEIMNPPLSVAQAVRSELQVQNPFSNSINIYASTTITNAEVTLVDVSGKIVLAMAGQQISGNFEIPISIEAGMYLLTIRSAAGTITKKLVKN